MYLSMWLHPLLPLIYHFLLDKKLSLRRGLQGIVEHTWRTWRADCCLRNVWNPAFDVTPANLISGIITEKGVVTKTTAGGAFDIKAFVTVSLCGKTCDACRHPNLVARCLEDFTTACALRQKNGSSRIFRTSSTDAIDREQLSEFWNQDEEANGSEEDIPDSDGSN
ncbi:hypothetical protein JHK84_042922 [Glycine max]|nr:hypothetical protein JHK84_042922 [Glycine max]